MKAYCRVPFRFSPKMSFAQRKATYKNYKLDKSGKLQIPRTTAYYQKKRARDTTSSEGICESAEQHFSDSDDPMVTVRTVHARQLDVDEQDPLSQYVASLPDWMLDEDLGDEDSGTLANHSSPGLIDAEELSILIELEKYRKFRSTKERLNVDLASAYLARWEIAELEGRQTVFPKSIYLLRKLFENAVSFKQPVYYFCPSHGCLLEPVMMGEKCNTEFVCEIDPELGAHRLHIDQLHQNSILVVSLEEQLQTLLAVRGDEIEACVTARNSAAQNGDIPDILFGDYYQKYLLKKIDKMDLTLIIHIDGARIAGSSDLSAYAVHWTLAEQRASSRNHNGILHTLCIARKEHMPHRKVMLKPFLEEMKRLSTIGMTRTVGGKKVSFRLFVACCIADVMERVPLVGVSSIHCPTGCPICLAPTTTWQNPDNYKSHKQVYLYSTSVNATKRTDESIAELGQQIMALPPEAREKARKNPKYCGIWDASPLMPLKTFHLVYSLPPDYMHMFLKGIIPDFDSACHYKPGSDAEVDRRQSVLDAPNALSHKFRTWTQRPTYKANEWMTDVFVGPYLLHELVNDVEFNIWGLLVSVATTATQDCITPHDISMLRQETDELVRLFQIHFGESFMVFNVHQLLHIADACQKFGSMSNYCALAGEDWIGRLLKNLKGFNQMTRELANTLALNKIANYLAEKVSKGNGHTQSAYLDLLDKISRTQFHSSSKKVEGGVLLGKRKTVSTVQAFGSTALTELMIFVQQEYGAADAVKKAGVYQKIIVDGYLLSAVTSRTDEIANSLLYTHNQLLRMLFAIDFSELGSGNIPVLLVCYRAQPKEERPYGLPWYLPTFSLFLWTNKIVIVPVNEFKGIFIETPYSASVKLACKLPKVLFRMD